MQARHVIRRIDDRKQRERQQIHAVQDRNRCQKPSEEMNEHGIGIGRQQSIGDQAEHALQAQALGVERAVFHDRGKLAAHRRPVRIDRATAVIERATQRPLPISVPFMQARNGVSDTVRSADT